jgi:hypothetical protein
VEKTPRFDSHFPAGEQTPAIMYTTAKRRQKEEKNKLKTNTDNNAKNKEPDVRYLHQLQEDEQVSKLSARGSQYKLSTFSRRNEEEEKRNWHSKRQVIGQNRQIR